MTRVIAHVSRKRADQALRDDLVVSEALHRGFVDTLEGCMICVDVAGTITFANRYATDLLVSNGVPLEGLSILALSHDGGQGQLTRIWRAAANGESVHDVDTRHEVDDRVHTIRWSVRPLSESTFALYDSAGTVRPNFSTWAVLAIGIDVTDRVERERQSAEDDAMSILAALTTGLAHEIRNPLNAAKLQLELLLLRAKLAGDVPMQDRLAEPATLVRNAIDRLSVLFEEFLCVAQPRLPVRTNNSVIKLFDSVVVQQQRLMSNTRIVLSSFVHEEGLMARCDADKISQVLTNLIRNSCEALRERGYGHVELHAERRTEGGVSISVVDNGPGLAADMHGEAAFVAFATTKAAGTGLGLSIVSKIVSQHGGTIQLLNRPGLGTTARFWISQ